MAQLTSLHEKKIYPIKTGMELLQAFRCNSALPFKFSCTQGDCGVCAINVIEGNSNLSKKTRTEIATLGKKKLSPSYRLACQCSILGDVTIM
ncbi:MAG: (2Fe-2S)-binding protein [Candidatus Protochlamydia sp.]|nr:(2Fe-2S)-binding protein [Candidatus Protochlamydia sp.]